MGVDVNCYAVGDVSDEQLEQANLFLTERRVTGGYDDDRPPLVRYDHPDGERIEWATLDRYYGPGYERGWWPNIYNGIRCIRAALPQCAVYYGGDTMDYAPEATDEWLNSIWDHWLGPDGMAYRNR